MNFFGLHALDAGVVLLYVLVILWLGQRVGRRTKDTEDFYLAGRRLGKFYQFFLNFGNATNADQAVAVSREIYRQGIGGMWIQYLVLFLTPFYWFSSLLFRRSRLTTLGDYFTERFQSPFLGGAFAVFTLALALVGGGVGYTVAAKMMMALTPKAESEYSAAEHASVEMYREYQQLKERLGDGLEPEESARYEELNERHKRGELRSLISHTDPEVFYLAYAAIVAAYTVLGGFAAAAITDAFQGVLIICFSIMLIPIGLNRIGGFSGLHAAVPEHMFALFGSAATSEYAWYTILAMVIANLVSIVASAPLMATAGSARDEMTARVGVLGGMFFKRFIMLFWALAGLLAIGLYGGKLHDPDLIWGHMTYDLLFPGAIGLMLAGVLAANMSTLDATSVTNSALFIKNLYQPLRPGRPERHYLNVGRVVTVLVIFGGVAAAMVVDSLLELFKYFISLPAVFGAAIWLGFVWRRLTKSAVIAQVVICFTLYAVIPNLFQVLECTRGRAAFLVETAPRVTVVAAGALAEDVAAGRATTVGETIRKQHVLEPAGVFFEKVVRIDPRDPASPRQGQGRFHAEIWVLSWLGIDFSRWSKAELVAMRFFFDAFFPFLLLFLISAFTRPVASTHLDRFFGKLRTPVQADPEEERRALEDAARHPERFVGSKLLPWPSFEIHKPSKSDWWGFGGSWLLVGLLVFLLWAVVNLGR
ncbi:MAG: sodium:solute symporter family protein [Planctomycetes bacterium]|nr:sodium:solute symporter family protein [Planctomycetota bacterium]